MIPVVIEAGELDSASPMAASVRMAALNALTEQDLAEWAGLTEASAADSIFAADWFVRPMLTQFDPDGQARLVIASNILGQWIGVAVLISENWLGRVPLWHWSGYANPNVFLGVPLVRHGHEAIFWRGLLRTLDLHSAGEAALAVTEFPADHRVTRALVSLCARESRDIEVLAQRKRAALVGASDMAAAMEQGLSSRRLSRLRSLERKLEREHGPVQCVRAKSDAEIAAWIETFLVLEASGWKGRAGSALDCADNTAALFREAVRGGHARDAICCLSLKLGDRTIAMTSYFASAGHGFGFKCCFDESFASYAPGIMLLRKAMESAGAGQALSFDSCSSPAESTINSLWPERREMLDLCVGLHTHLGDPRRAGALAARRWWHRLKVARRYNIYPI